MAELHVGQGRQYATLAAAAAVARPGDMVVVHGGTYPGGFRPPQGTTWLAGAGTTPVIDGGWNGKKTHPQDGKANGVLIGESDVTLRGFVIRNVAGKGLAVTTGGHRFTMEDCEIYGTLNGGFGANGLGNPILGITIRNCHAHDISLSGQWYETPVNGCFLFKSAHDVLVEDTLIERGYGEGIAAGSRSRNVTFRRVTVANTVHLGMYVANRARDVLVEDCVIYQDGSRRQGDGDVGAGFVVGDEESGEKDDKWQHSENVTMRRCLAVNCGIAFQLRNGTKAGNKPGALDGYNTKIQNLTVERCTFVTGPDSKLGVTIGENDQGAKVRGVFRNNLFVFDTMRTPDAQRLRHMAAGVKFSGNVWTPSRPDPLPDDYNGDAAGLVAPWVGLSDGFNLDNYRPVSGGPLAGAGIGALDVAGTEPPPDPDPDPEPEPEPEPVPDWRDLLDERGRVLVANCQLHGAGPDWTPDGWVYRLIAQLAEMLDEHYA